SARLWFVDVLPAARAFADPDAAHGDRGRHPVGAAYAGAATRAGAAADGDLGGCPGALHGSWWASAVLGPSSTGRVGQSARQCGAGAWADRPCGARSAAAREAQRMATRIP